MAPARVGDRPGDRVHADVVVPVGDERRTTVSPSSGCAQLEVAPRRRAAVVVELLLLLVGVERALDQPLGLAGRDVAAHLDAGELLGDGHDRCRGSPRAGSTSLRPRPVGSARPPRLATASTATRDHDQPGGDDRARRRSRAPQLAAPVAARAAARPAPAAARAPRRAARRRSAMSTTTAGPWRSGPRAGWRCSAYRWTQLLGAVGVGLAELDVDPDRRTGVDAEVGQERAGVQHDVPVEGRLDHARRGWRARWSGCCSGTGRARCTAVSEQPARRRSRHAGQPGEPAPRRRHGDVRRQARAWATA